MNWPWARRKIRVSTPSPIDRQLVALHNAKKALLVELKVKKYMPHPHNFHMCENCETGRELRVDLFVGGNLPEGTTPESLVGKTVEVAYLHSYTMIAHDVKIIDDCIC